MQHCSYCGKTERQHGGKACVDQRLLEAVAMKPVRFLRVWAPPSSSQIYGIGNIVKVTEYWFNTLTTNGIAEAVCQACSGSGQIQDVTRHPIYGDQVMRLECETCEGTGVMA